ADRSDVDVGLVADELFLRHGVPLLGEPSPRIELGTPSLPRKCTTTVLRGRSFSTWRGRAKGLEPSATRLEGWSSTNLATPASISFQSDDHLVEGGGFEPP